MNKVLKTLFLFIIFSNSVLYAQDTVRRFYYLQLKDKNNTEFSLSAPAAYLSEKALARRQTMNIPIDSTDLPVNSLYINQITATGAEVFALTKWQNGVTIRLADTDTASVLPQLRNLNFITKIEYTGIDVADVATSNSNINNRLLSVETSDSDYGDGLTPLVQLNGKPLHDMGFRGAGVTIAVIDGGFINADNHIAFDSLRTSGRLLGTHDFAYRTDNVFRQSTHGAQVLSLMASNLPDSLIGTAPDAQYWLLISERIQGEYPVEVDLWITAAEFADSIGADIITSSLGYTTFNDNSLNYHYSDLDGQTIRASRAASQAAEKGIVVFNSAGNDGNNDWHYIGVPADARKIISVGAVNAQGSAANFSSYGPTFDARVKPELCAMGYNTTVANCLTTDKFTKGSGTSYSAPILAGMTACLLQALKEKSVPYTPDDVINKLIESASNFPSNTDQCGYGIPDFVSALYSFISTDNIETNENEFFTIKYFGNKIIIEFVNQDKTNSVTVYNTLGQILLSTCGENDEISFDKSIFPKGILILGIKNQYFSTIKKMIN
ncbi:MAG: S8 family peptidase [Paludibacter sp.]|nr:S8 family peptidase [Paludibacter sp.]